MKRATRNLDPDRGLELLERAQRACICFACDQGAQAEPVVLASRDGRYLAGLPAHAKCLPSLGQEVVLLVDEGARFFDLRAISIRGRAAAGEAPADAPVGHAWFEVVPVKISGWDFGALRVVSDRA